MYRRCLELIRDYERSLGIIDDNTEVQSTILCGGSAMNLKKEHLDNEEEKKGEANEESEYSSRFESSMQISKGKKKKNKQPWLPQELQKLKEKAEMLKSSWVQVSYHFHGTRTPSECRLAYHS